jgi:hypothetical protein
MTGIGDKKIGLLYYENPDLLEAYFTTFYNILALMSGNDIQACDSLQVYLSILIGNIGSINLGIVYGNLAFIIEKINFSSVNMLVRLNDMREKMDEISENMGDDKKLPAHVQNKVIFFLRFCSEKARLAELSNKFNELSEPLEEDIQFELYGKIINKIP